MSQHHLTGPQFAAVTAGLTVEQAVDLDLPDIDYTIEHDDSGWEPTNNPNPNDGPYPPLVSRAVVYCHHTERFGWVWRAKLITHGGGQDMPAQSEEDAENRLRAVIRDRAAFWQEKVTWQRAGDVTPDGQRVVRVRGQHYVIGPQPTDGRNRDLLGFGGRRFRFRMHGTGEIVVSSNVWFQGVIPAEFASLLPDNAVKDNGEG